MIVVADTTPLCHLAWMEADWLLPRLFGEVHAPERVMGELRAEGAPDPVRQWAANPPGWLKIHSDTPDENRVFAFETIDAGEREALALALALHASLVIVDDRAARRAATDLGFVTTGTLGVLERAARMRLVDFDQTIARLRATSFWVRESIIGKSASGCALADTDAPPAAVSRSGASATAEVVQGEEAQAQARCE